MRELLGSFDLRLLAFIGGSDFWRGLGDCVIADSLSLESLLSVHLYRSRLRGHFL